MGEIQMETLMKVSILMPCLNEAETLEMCISKANGYLRRTNTDGEVVIADNGSTDGSQEIARRNCARVVDVPIRGYGAALYYGAINSHGEYIIMADSDNSYDFSNLAAFVEKLDEGFDLVMGNRFWGGIEPGAMPWKNRYIGNPILTWIGRTLFNCPAHDFHCGLRGFRKEAFMRMDLRTTGMEFASEMVIKATLFGMKIAEVPTTLSKDGRSRPPHLKPWRDGWRHLRFMLLFSPRWLFIIPGIVIILVGSFVYFSVLSGPLRVGNIILDIHTLFYTQAAITIGFISILLGIVARIFGMREGLLREHKAIDNLQKMPILEIGSTAGLLIMIAGFYYGIVLFSAWGKNGFGKLEQGYLLKSVSLSTMCITLGGIILLGSLVIGFLTLSTRNDAYK